MSDYKTLDYEANLSAIAKAADTPPSIRERLEDAARSQWKGQPTMFADMVDAILTELQEPSPDMVRATWTHGDIDAGDAWSIMIQHIKDGGS